MNIYEIQCRAAVSVYYSIEAEDQEAAQMEAHVEFEKYLNKEMDTYGQLDIGVATLAEGS